MLNEKILKNVKKYVVQKTGSDQKLENSLHTSRKVIKKVKIHTGKNEYEIMVFYGNDNICRNVEDIPSTVPKI